MATTARAPAGRLWSANALMARDYREKPPPFNRPRSRPGRRPFFFPPLAGGAKGRGFAPAGASCPALATSQPSIPKKWLPSAAPCPPPPGSICLFGLLKSVFADKPPADADPDDYRDASEDLLRLDQLASGLGRHALRFVFTGEDAAILQALTAHKHEVAKVLGFADNRVPKPAGRSAVLFRARRWSGALVQRYAEVLAIAAAGGWNSYPRRPPKDDPFPSWLWLVLYDAYAIDLADKQANRGRPSGVSVFEPSG